MRTFFFFRGGPFMSCVLGVGAAAWIAGGCASTRPGGPGAVSRAKVKPTVNQPTEIVQTGNASTETAAESPALASVMDFLERTAEYQSSSTARDGAAHEQRSRGEGSAGHHLPVIETVVAEGAAARDSGAAAPVAASRSAQANTQLSLVDSPAGRPAAPPTVKSLRVRTVEASGAAPEANPPRHASNQGMEVVRAETADEARRWVSALAEKARREPGFEREWTLRLVQAGLGEAVEGEAVGRGLTEDQRRLMTGVMAVLSAIRREAGNPQLSGEESLRAVTELTGLLAERADPVVTAMALCRRVVTFGVYEEMAAGEFAAGRATPTIVYCEIGNLRSEKGSDGLYRSKLATRVELFTADGRSVWRHEEPEISDLCRNARRDFFVAQRVTLPATLSEGPHVLKVTVEDKLSGRTTEQTMRLTVGGTAVAKGK